MLASPQLLEICPSGFVGTGPKGDGLGNSQELAQGGLLQQYVQNWQQPNNGVNCINVNKNNNNCTAIYTGINHEYKVRKMYVEPL